MLFCNRQTTPDVIRILRPIDVLGHLGHLGLGSVQAGLECSQLSYDRSTRLINVNHFGNYQRVRNGSLRHVDVPPPVLIGDYVLELHLGHQLRLPQFLHLRHVCSLFDVFKHSFNRRHRRRGTSQVDVIVDVALMLVSTSASLAVLVRIRVRVRVHLGFGRLSLPTTAATLGSPRLGAPITLDVEKPPRVPILPVPATQHPRKSLPCTRFSRPLHLQQPLHADRTGLPHHLCHQRERLVIKRPRNTPGTQHATQHRAPPTPHKLPRNLLLLQRKNHQIQPRTPQRDEPGTGRRPRMQHGKQRRHVGDALVRQHLEVAHPCSDRFLSLLPAARCARPRQIPPKLAPIHPPDDARQLPSQLLELLRRRRRFRRRFRLGPHLQEPTDEFRASTALNKQIPSHQRHPTVPRRLLPFPRVLLHVPIRKLTQLPPVHLHRHRLIRPPQHQVPTHHPVHRHSHRPGLWLPQPLIQTLKPRSTPTRPIRHATPTNPPKHMNRRHILLTRHAAARRHRPDHHLRDLIQPVEDELVRDIPEPLVNNRRVQYRIPHRRDFHRRRHQPQVFDALTALRFRIAAARSRRRRPACPPGPHATSHTHVGRSIYLSVRGSDAPVAPRRNYFFLNLEGINRTVPSHSRLSDALNARLRAYRIDVDGELQASGEAIALGDSDRRPPRDSPRCARTGSSRAGRAGVGAPAGRGCVGCSEGVAVVCVEEGRAGAVDGCVAEAFGGRAVGCRVFSGAHRRGGRGCVGGCRRAVSGFGNARDARDGFSWNDRVVVRACGTGSVSVVGSVPRGACEGASGAVRVSARGDVGGAGG